MAKWLILLLRLLSSGLNDSIEVVRKKGKIILFGLTQDDLIPFNQNNFYQKLYY